MLTLRHRAPGGLTLLFADAPALASLAHLREVAPGAPVYPVAPSSLDLAEGDLLIADVVSNPLALATIRALSIDDATWRDLGPGGHAVLSDDLGKRRVLVVLGGDAGGLAAGAERVAARLTPGQDGLVYDGDTTVSRPAFGLRLLWTWDHSTNWNLDAAGQLDWGYQNRYKKPPAAFLDDYRRLLAAAARAGINGVVIWGLLRDSHGGLRAAKELCDVAARLGVRILAGVGTSFYGGFYYEGDHPFNADRWLHRHPTYAAQDRAGRPSPRLCPTHPANAEWLREGTRWLFSALNLGGLNLESGDFFVCYCASCRAARDSLNSDDPDFYKEMLLSIGPAVEEALLVRPDAWITYGTYTGFAPGPLPRDLGDPNPGVVHNLANCGGPRPGLIGDLPAAAVCQWSLTGMLRPEPVRLLDLLEDGAPPALRESPDWPVGLRPPSKRSLGYFHQGSQWYGRRPGDHTRYSVELASIMEACLRGTEAGLEGLAIQGEVSSRLTPNELNYLAFAHFTYRPGDSLRAFARATLAPYLGGVDLAEAYVEWLARIEGGELSGEDRRRLDDVARAQADAVAGDGDWDTYRRWRWLATYPGNVTPRALAESTLPRSRSADSCRGGPP